MKPIVDRKRISVEKIWLTTEELNQYLGFGNGDTQQEWRDTGMLPYYQIGRKILYLKADIDDFVKRHRVTPITNNVQNYGKSSRTRSAAAE